MDQNYKKFINPIMIKNFKKQLSGIYNEVV